MIQTIVEKIDKKSGRPVRSKNIADALSYAYGNDSGSVSIRDAIKKATENPNGSDQGIKEALVTKNEIDFYPKNIAEAVAVTFETDHQPTSIIDAMGGYEPEPKEPTWEEYITKTGITGTSTYGGTEYVVETEGAVGTEFTNGSQIKIVIGDVSGTTSVTIDSDPDTEAFNGYIFDPTRFAGSESAWMIYTPWSTDGTLKLNYNGPDAPETIDVTIYKEA